MASRIVLLVTSPRVPVGLLTAAAWDLVRAHPVFAAEAGELTAALATAGAAVTLAPGRAEDLIAAAAAHGTVVWLAGPGGDEAFARDLGMRLAREPGTAELELMYGSWDPPGARLLDVVTVMDRLVSPGGDPWKREQTHQTLARFLMEEAYEAYDAIAAGDHDALREELGDVLLQVVLHARMAEEAESPWTIDDLAGNLVDKLVRRNPHVFGDVDRTDVGEITEAWERIKQQEKGRRSALDGIVLTQPALALAAKVLSRLERAGLPGVDTGGGPAPEVASEAALGAALLALVDAARRRGFDAEGALRTAAMALIDAARAAES
jgi:XTP/dITP diphosphohydrolase